MDVTDIINELKNLGKARSPSGKAPVCNTVIAGSNPARASSKSIGKYFLCFLYFVVYQEQILWYNIYNSRGSRKYNIEDT